MYNKYTIKKIFGLPWLKMAKGCYGGQTLVNSSKPDGNKTIKIFNYNYGHVWTDCNKQELIKLLATNKNIYEIITEYPMRVYFDIDKPGKTDDDYLTDFLKLIKVRFPFGKFAVSGSVTDAKTSYHIVISNYIISNSEQLEKLKVLVTHLKKDHNEFDNSIYHLGRAMKAVNQSKPDGRIQKIIIGDVLEDHLITFCSGFEKYSMNDCDVTDIEDDFKIVKSTKPIKLIIPSSNLIFDASMFEIYNYKEPLSETQLNNILKWLPLDASYNHTYTHRIARFIYSMGYPLDLFLNWYSQKSTEQQKLNKWTANWEKLGKFPRYDLLSIIHLLEIQYNQLRDGKEQYLLNNLMNIDSLPSMKVEKLKPNLYGSSEKFIIINTGMGSGKTSTVIEFLKNKPSYLFITNNQALAHSLHGRCNGLKHYQNFKNKNEMMHCDKLVICVNSLGYIKHARFDIVVIDEIESLLKGFISNDTLEHIDEIFQIFVKLLVNTTKCIVMDAFTTRITTNFINSILGNNICPKSHMNSNEFLDDSLPKTPMIYNENSSEYLMKSHVKIIKRFAETSDRELIIINSWDEHLNKIIESLKQNKKLFIFYPFLTEHKNKSVLFPSMCGLQQLLKMLTGKAGLIYNSQIDAKDEQGLKNVNNSWSNVDYVITNTKITTGISYDEGKPFDEVYLIIAGFTSPRDAIQASYRVRQLTTNHIFCYVITNNRMACIKNDTPRVDNYKTIFNQLVEDVAIEKMAPIRETLMMFANKTGYKIIDVNETIKKDIIKIDVPADVKIDFNDIIDVNSSQVNLIENKKLNGTISTAERLQVKKYFFKKLFTSDVSTKQLSLFWDNCNFSLKVDKLAGNPIFESIKNYNKWSSVMPSDEQLNKVKLSDEIKTEIFINYKFKYLDATSTDKKIIYNLFRSEFGQVVNCYTIDKKNYLYKISKKARTLYNSLAGCLASYNSKKSSSLFDTTNLDPFMDDEDDGEFMLNHLVDE